MSAMLRFLSTLLLAATHVSAVSVKATPHFGWSSSLGLLGCRSNIDRQAFFPEPWGTGSDQFCVKVTKGSKSLYLLRVDMSAGAHDMSPSAFMYLTGQGEAKQGADFNMSPVQMDIEYVGFENCAGLIDEDGGKVPVISGALGGPWVSNGWFADKKSPFYQDNLVVWQYADVACMTGQSATCTLGGKGGGAQVTCPGPGAAKPTPIVEWALSADNTHIVSTTHSALSTAWAHL